MKILIIMLTTLLLGTTTYASSLYSDVSSSDVHFKAIQETRELGLLPDYGDKFEPNKPVTRAELAEAIDKLHNENINGTVNAVAHVMPLTVKIIAFIDPPGGHVSTSTGSGVIIDSHHVLTARHVVTDGRIHVITMDGQSHPGTVVKAERINDLAIVEFSTLTNVTSGIELSDTAMAGEDAITIGHPSINDSDLDFSVSKGIVSYVDRSLNTWSIKTQVDTPINEGNSGGPVFNLSGKLIGIVTSGYSTKQNINFIIPLDTIKEFLHSFYHPTLIEQEDLAQVE
jgi:S1-C subfamily serine protease